MRNTTTAGDLAEATVIAAFVRAGFPVLLPFGTQRYDLVIEAGGRFLRVQCKVASPCGWNGDKSAIRFHASSSRYTAGKFRGREAYTGQADLFAVFAPSTGQVYVLPIDDDLPTTDIWLRTTPTTANNQHGIRMASDHTIEAWATKQG